ncbi:hypothetical protein BKA57DRAFT_328212 [Linnemannia elongata]|nr:hypothetical protein BKA57DRAFT_328212 [Linnemannia elongata]
MKSFTTILFAAFAVLTFTSAVPLPEDPTDDATGSKEDLRNPNCKIPIQAKFDKCMNKVNRDAVACREPYDAGNKHCDDIYKTSVSIPN